MNNIFSYYTKYRNHVDEYNRWIKNDGEKVSGSTKPNYSISANSEELLKKKAETIAEPILLFDSYVHEKAEDSETFFQTLNIELMSITGILASLPITITKLIPFLTKHAGNNKIARKAADSLLKYKNSIIKAAGREIKATKIATIVTGILSAFFFANGIKKSMEAQLGLIRKAGFDATQNLINDPKLFALLTPEQEEKVNSIVNYQQKNKAIFVDKLKDKIDINSSFQSVGEYKRTLKSYKKRKDEYFDGLEKINANSASSKMKEEQEDRILLSGLLKNVEHKVLEPLRRVETISNISYSAMFTGGFLEYLISDKLVDVLGIKNKFISMGIKIGVPLLTYLILNKNISDIENKAILATKYKYLKKFTQNPMQNSTSEEKKKENIFVFIKNTLKDMKDYDKFAQTELPKLKQKMDAKKQIELTAEQIQDAKALQKNTAMALNIQKEEVYNQTVGIKSLSETILGPIDIIATAIGGTIGNKLAKKCGNTKLKGFLTGIGAVIAFIPAAIIEVKLTKQQKLSEKIAAMLAIKRMENSALFIQNSNNYRSTINTSNSSIFKDFIK